MLSRHPLDDRQPQTTGELTAPVVEAAEQLGLVFITARSLEVIISRLRDKVLRETGQTLPLRARRGLGYRFTPSD
jgi:DNA-binding response OmpR family regulator